MKQPRQTRAGPYRKKEIADIVRNVDSNSHLGKVKAIAQANESKSNNVVKDQLLEVFSRLFQLQHEYYGLLCPVRRLQQVVGLEDALVRAMGESFEHGRRVEIPERPLFHHIQTEWPEDAEVHGRVGLLHEA